MTRSDKIQERRLTELEAEFQPLLIDCLEQSSRGRYGLFGQNAHIEHYDRIFRWPEAKRVKELAAEIQTIHASFGSSNKTCEEFQRFCALSASHQQNTPGEPKLASEFLARIERESS
jgi:hypothetical protein